jgi:shikimate dehydrogenase
VASRQRSEPRCSAQAGASRPSWRVSPAQGAKEIRLSNRTIDKAREIADAVGSAVKVVPWDQREDALDGVAWSPNATSAGAAGKPPLDIALDRLPKHAIAGDLIYVPPGDAVPRRGAARGNVTVNGLGLLLQPGASRRSTRGSA